jgi:hypothetical protein
MTTPPGPVRGVGDAKPKARIVPAKPAPSIIRVGHGMVLPVVAAVQHAAVDLGELRPARPIAK